MGLYRLNEIDCREYPGKLCGEVEVMNQEIEECLLQMEQCYQSVPLKEGKEIITSELNYLQRHNTKSSRTFGINVRPGDICYIDYGKAYITEIGYQHFGVVLNVFDGKAFVIPLTSNPEAIELAMNENGRGNHHLLKVGMLPGLDRASVAFLNDGRYINTVRIIKKVGFIHKQSDDFKRLYRQFLKGLDPYKND